MEAASTIEKLVNFCQTTLSNKPEDNNPGVIYLQTTVKLWIKGG
jgi:hypothetical protein